MNFKATTNGVSDPDAGIIVQVEHAKVRHLEHVLFEKLDFTQKKGEQWAVMGSSGSGKTALLHTLLGKFNIVNGNLRYPALAAFKKAKQIDDPLFTYRKMMSFIGQQARFRNKENMNDFFYQQRYHSIYSEEADTVEEFLHKEEIKMQDSPKPIRLDLDWIKENFQLESLLQKTLIQLSNGETRRLMIAAALIEQPLILLMDNPYIGLDTASRPVLDQILQKIKDSGIHMIMATTPREIPDCITHIVWLDKMEIVYSGPKEEVLPLINRETSTSQWKPDPQLLEKIKELQPHQDHHFKKAIKMEDIHVRSSQKVILENIDWEVAKGEKWSLYGPNGAGKSTLLSLINGDHPQAYANQIFLFDKKRGSGESIWELKHKMGFVSPELHQYFKARQTSLEVILTGLTDVVRINLEKVASKNIQLAEYWLELLDLSKIKNERFTDLSAGHQRLVLLLRALIKNPPLMILDEPCQGLDIDQRTHFKHVINQLWNHKSKTLLYVSHYKEDIPSIVNKLIELEKGRIKSVEDTLHQ